MDSFGIALSGLQAAQAQINVAANNIANVNTPGFSAQSVNQVDVPGGGVDVADIQSTGQPVDLAAQLVKLRQAAVIYDANAMVLDVQNRMVGSVLNVLDNQNQDQGWDNSY